MTQYSRKRRVRQRYDVECDKSVERMVRDFRIPKPEYHGTRIPRWSDEKLDRNDRALALQSEHVRSEFKRLLAEITTATTLAEARAILHVAQLNGKLADLTEAQIEGLQDAVTEKS